MTEDAVLAHVNSCKHMACVWCWEPDFYEDFFTDNYLIIYNGDNPSLREGTLWCAACSEEVAKDKAKVL